jgi:N-methylhydantoinase A
LTAVYDRARLAPGDELKGPVVIEEPESTTVLPPGYGLQIDRHLNLLIDRA